MCWWNFWHDAEHLCPVYRGTVCRRESATPYLPAWAVAHPVKHAPKATELTCEGHISPVGPLQQCLSRCASYACLVATALPAACLTTSMRHCMRDASWLLSLSRLNYRVPECEVHPETMESEQSPICTCNAASKDGTRRCNASTATLGISRNAGGRDCRPVHGPPAIVGAFLPRRHRVP